jgi:hypothetical protein
MSLGYVLEEFSPDVFRPIGCIDGRGVDKNDILC